MSASRRANRLVDRIALRLSRRHPAAARQRLNYRRIFILPTRSGLGFLFVAFLIFILSVNYVLSLGLALAFLMFALFPVSILQTFRNLYGLEIHADGQPGSEVFAGEPAFYRLCLTAHGRGQHHAIRLRFRGQDAPVRVSLRSGKATVSVPLDATVRGWCRAPALRIESIYPFGLCRAWSDVDLALSCLAYPAPERPDVPVPGVWSGAGRQQSADIRSLPEGDDFAGLRDYRSGDALSRIAWKSLAGRQQLQVKQFHQESGVCLLLDWELFPRGVSVEKRLSWLCHQVVQAEADGLNYSLSLPGQHLPAGQGAQHRRRLLRALALFGEPEERQR